jgi:hypothetical protein
MKIHALPLPPPLPPPSPPKAAPTDLEVALKGEELIKTAQQQRAQRSKLYRVRRNPRDADENSDPQANEKDHQAPRKAIDFLA